MSSFRGRIPSQYTEAAGSCASVPESDLPLSASVVITTPPPNALLTSPNGSHWRKRLTVAAFTVISSYCGGVSFKQTQARWLLPRQDAKLPEVAVAV